MDKIAKNSGSLRGYTLTLSILILSGTLIALALYAAEWRRSQQASPANFPSAMEATLISQRMRSDVSNLVGANAEITRNSTSVSIKIIANLPFKKEGLSVADITEYARSIPGMLGNEIPYEIVLTSNSLNMSNSTVLVLPDSGAVLFENNGTNDTDLITYRHPLGWNLTGVSASIYCANSQPKVTNISSSAGAGPITYSITYSDSSGTYTSTNSTQLINNVSYSVSSADGTNLSFITNISANGQGTTRIYYTKNPGAIMYLPFDVNVSSNATGAVSDYTQNGKNATLGGGNSSRLPIWTPSGASGGAYTFNGANTFMNVSSIPNVFSKASGGTFAAWLNFRPGSLNRSHGVIYHAWGASTQNRITLTDPGGVVGFQPTNWNSGASYSCSNATLIPNNWYHLAVTSYETGGMLYSNIYLNGTLKCSYASVVNGTIYFDSNTTSRIIGHVQDDPNPPAGYRYFFNGSMDEIRIYNRTLSDAEVFGLYSFRYQNPCYMNLTFTYDASSFANRELSALFNADLKVRTRIPDSVLIMPFDINVTRNSTDSVLDYSSSGNNGVLGGSVPAKSPIWTSNGKSGGAYVFDGNMSYVELPSTPSLDTLKDMTIAAWYYMLAPPNSGHGTGIISKGNGNVNNGQYELIVHGSGKPALRGSAQNKQFTAYCNTNVSLSLNTWHFTAISFNGSQTNCYTDGYADGTTNDNTLIMPLNSSGTSLAIGVRQLQRNTAGVSHFNGTIDEVRIYDRVLSTDELDSIYKDTLLVSQGPLVASYD